MNLVNSKRLWIAAAIIAVIIVAGFIISVPHARDGGRPPVQTTIAPRVPTVTLHDVYKKGTHTITGYTSVSNACTTASALASLVGGASSTQSILVSVTVPTDTGTCLQVPTRANFTVTVAAPANIPMTATINGAVASTTPS